MRKITVNHSKKTLEMTSTFATAASKYGTDSYKELVSAKRDFPNYTVIITKASHRKENYKGLTQEVMKKYIIAHSSADSEQMKEFISRTKNIDGMRVKVDSYGELRKWFLETYPEVKKAA